MGRGQDEAGQGLEDRQLLEDWNRRLDCAEQMLPLIGRLYRRRGIVTKVYDRLLVNQSPIELIRVHKAACRVTLEEVSVFDTYEMLQALIDEAPVGRLRIDIGKLVTRFKKGPERHASTFLRGALLEVDSSRLPRQLRPRDIVLYGFGRVGRLVGRLFVDKTESNQGARLRAIVTRPGRPDDLIKRAGLLRRDSVHGPFNGTIRVDPDREALIANGNVIHLLHADRPDEVDYAAVGIEDAIVIDNTGRWRDREGLSLHLRAKGAAKVVLTAPGRDDIPNIVYGVNHDDIRDEERVLSAASCTTNAIVPVLKLVEDRFGVEHGHIESCHAYTNDQNLIDNYHKKPRRGRAAAINMVITETGAAKAVAKALPSLAGKLSGSAIRVPTPNVSLAVLMLRLREPTTVEGINEFLRRESLEGRYQLQIDYSCSPDAVSTDFVGNGHAGIVDALATQASGHDVVLYVWYDNEFGYARQVVRIAERIAGLRPPSFPRE